MCGRVDVEQMLGEITPEQMNGHIAAMRAEPWGNEREDYRLAFLVYWMFNLWGTVEDNQEKPEAEEFLASLKDFMSRGTTEEKQVILSPDEAAEMSKGLF